MADYGSGPDDPPYGAPGDTFFNTTLKTMRVFSALDSEWTSVTQLVSPYYTPGGAVPPPTTPTEPVTTPGTDSGEYSIMGVQTLSAERAVIPVGDGTLYDYADPTDVTTVDRVCVMTTEAQPAGTPIPALDFGEYSMSTWNWTPNAPIYCGFHGSLTQVAPTVEAGYAFSLQVAYAMDSTTLFWDPQPPIILA